MRLLESWLSYLLYAFDIASFSSHGDGQLSQAPLQEPSILHHQSDGPVFSPPYPPNDPPPRDVAIKCNYSAMGSDWQECNSPNDRGCWLKGPGNKNFSIKTNYERITPKGITRKYVLDVSEMALSPDGVCMPHAKVFNGSYPGPWIQACWGDDLEITVRNHLWNNEATIHWYGIRQHNSVEMDGVNGVTQCPIAPREEFT